MNKLNLLHNPGAGNEDHFEEELIKDIQSEGFECRYFSIKEGVWKKHLEEPDFIVVAGGDGTVRNVVREMVKAKSGFPLVPVAVLPMGTANNLSQTLGIDPSKSHCDHIKKWKNPRFQTFDLGFAKIDGHKEVFLESVGFGLFPSLINYMKHRKEVSEAETAEQKLAIALKALITAARTFEPVICKIQAEEVQKGIPCLLFEVMNTQSIGPNLFMAPDADTADGTFDIVYVTEEQRVEFIAYLQQIAEGKKTDFAFKKLKCNKLEIQAEGGWMHIDDELLEMKGAVTLNVETGKKQIRFMV